MIRQKKKQKKKFFYKYLLKTKCGFFLLQENIYGFKFKKFFFISLNSNNTAKKISKKYLFKLICLVPVEEVN